MIKKNGCGSINTLFSRLLWAVWSATASFHIDRRTHRIQACPTLDIALLAVAPQGEIFVERRPKSRAQWWERVRLLHSIAEARPRWFYEVHCKSLLKECISFIFFVSQYTLYGSWLPDLLATGCGNIQLHKQTSNVVGRVIFQRQRIYTEPHEPPLRWWQSVPRS